MRLRNSGWILLLIITILVLVSYMFPGIVTDPQHHLFSLGGDGIKNEFTYLYQVLHGRGFWFEGMNYPFGEHIIYTDGQPLLSVPLAGLNRFVHFTPGGAMAVMEWALVLGYVLGGIYLWKLLVHLDVKPFPAVLFTICILFLSPQVFKLNGHFGLAYICVIPMQLYWLLLYHERGRRRYAIYLLMLILLSSLVHLYFLAMSLMLTGSYILYLLAAKEYPFRIRLRKAAPLVLAVLLAIGGLQTLIYLTDPVKDRPVTPLGFLGGCTVVDEIFKSHQSVIWQGLEEAGIIGGFAQPGEGNTYPGLVALIVSAMLIIRYVIRRVRKRRGKLVTPAHPALPPHFLFIAAVSLTVGMGIPFIWGLEWLVAYLPLVKQFRTLGRFSWVFYNIITIYAAVSIYRYYKSLLLRGKKVPAYGLMTLAIGVWMVEANGYLIKMRKEGLQTDGNYRMFYSVNEPGWPAFLQAHGYKASDFQGIMILPYFHIGTEKIWTGSEAPWSGWEMTLAAKASIALHLPIMDVMMSRSSWSQALQQIKTVAGPYSAKPVLSRLPDTRPLLVMVYEEAQLDPDHQYLLEGADSLGHFSQCVIYTVSPGQVLARDRARKAAIQPVLQAMTGSDTALNGCNNWYVGHADKDTKYPFFGTGARTTPGGSDALLAAVPIHPGTDSAWYECSVWALLTREDYRSPVFLMQCLDSAGKMILERDMPTRFTTDGEGPWYRASRYFRMPSGCRTFRFRLERTEDGRPGALAVDEWQLRPQEAVVISKDGKGKVLVNNHVLKID